MPLCETRQIEFFTTNSATVLDLFVHFQSAEISNLFLILYQRAVAFMTYGEWLATTPSFVFSAAKTT